MGDLCSCDVTLADVDSEKHAASLSQQRKRKYKAAAEASFLCASSVEELTAIQSPNALN